MSTVDRTLFLGCLVAAWALPAGPAQAQRTVTAVKPFDWQSASPESQGMSKEKLDALKDSLAARKTKAFLVIRSGDNCFSVRQASLTTANGSGRDK